MVRTIQIRLRDDKRQADSAGRVQDAKRRRRERVHMQQGEVGTDRLRVTRARLIWAGNYT